MVETTGDVRTDVPLHAIGGQGVFVKEVQQAVLDGPADLAVHSAKDLPSGPRPTVWCWPPCRRGVTRATRSSASTLARTSRRAPPWPPGPCVGGPSSPPFGPTSSSTTCAATSTRGSRKVPDGGAIVVAAAALERLGRTDHIAEVLEP